VKYRISHMVVQTQQVIIVPVDDAFEDQSAEKKEATRAALQACAKTARLAGSVALIWRTGESHKYLCPPQWEPFFATLSFETVLAHLNKELDCSPA
jgi:hypothetical protein